MDWPLPIRILLWPFSRVYGIGSSLRVWFYARGVLRARKLTAPVVSVGNLTVGGTGKTPMVLWLAERFLAEGKRVAILSRGYRGSGEWSDEIELMRSKLGDRVLFGVGPDRFAQGRKIESKGLVDVFLLDDGFQHLALARDVDILLVDSTRPLRRERLLPAGRLREPASAIARANLVVVTRAHQAAFAAREVSQLTSLPIFQAFTRLGGFKRFGADGETASLRELPQPIFAFCGVGNPDAFLADLGQWGVEVTGKKVFRDHHRYSEQDGKELGLLAKGTGAKALITTEKDAQNLRDLIFTLPVYCCEIRMEISDEAQFWDVVRRTLPESLEASS